MTNGHPNTPTPPRAIRVIGQALSGAVARWPRLWPLLRAPTRRFFDRAAPDWDRRIGGDSPEHLAALAAALDALERTPERILDLGTGTGVGAVMLARRFPAARVTGVDLSASMIELARKKAEPEVANRVDFAVADASALPHGSASFDLITQVSVPVFFDEIARLLAPGGHAIVVSSLGAATPFHTPERLLREGFGRRGLEQVAAGGAGPGLYFVARRPSER